MAYIWIFLLLAAFRNTSQGQKCCEYACKKGSVRCPTTLRKVGEIVQSDRENMHERLVAVNDSVMRLNDFGATEANRSIDIVQVIGERKMSVSIDAVVTKLEDSIATIFEQAERIINASLEDCLRRREAYNSLLEAGFFRASNQLWYKLSNREATYHDAKVDCVQNGSRLASSVVRNESVLMELFDNLIKDYRWVWVGLERKEDIDSWSWSDEYPYEDSDTAWLDGEPNNGGGDERCTNLYGTSLIDNSCSVMLHYLCEKASP